MNSSRQTFSIIEKAILVVALALSIAAIAVSSLGKRSQGGLGGEVAEPVTSMADSTIERIFGKTHYAGIDFIKNFADLCTSSADSVNTDRNDMNWHRSYLEDLFVDVNSLNLDDDVEKTPFALARMSASVRIHSFVRILMAEPPRHHRPYKIGKYGNTM